MHKTDQIGGLDPRYALFRGMPPAEFRATALGLGINRPLIDYHDRRLREIDHWARVAGTRRLHADHVLALALELGLRRIVSRDSRSREYRLTDKGVVLAVIREAWRQGIDIFAEPKPRTMIIKETPPMTTGQEGPKLTVASSVDTAVLSVDELRALAQRLRISREYMILLSMGFFIGSDKKDQPRGNGLHDLYADSAERNALAACVTSGEFLKPGARRTLRQEVAMRIYQLRKRGTYVLDDDAPLPRRQRRKLSNA